MQASERGTDGQTGEARLGDGRVDDPLLAEAVEETLGDLVTAAVSSVLAMGHSPGPRQPAIAAPTAAEWFCRNIPSTVASIAALWAQLGWAVWQPGGTYAPLYCATSSPRTKTLSLRSISSAMASLSASRTVISFWPEAYPLRAIDGVMAAARNAGRKAGRDAASRRAAGRVILEAAIVCDALGVLESEGGGREAGWKGPVLLL